jgi:pilus assembly protein Flp/PilA
MNQLIKRLLKEEQAATAIEYGLIAGLIAVSLVITLTNVGTKLKGLFQLIIDNLPSVVS